MWIDMIGAALLHSTWQFTLTGLALYLTLQWLPAHASRTRYVAACFALLTCIGLFIGTIIRAVPETSISITLSTANTPTAFSLSPLIVIAWVLGVLAIFTYNSVSLYQVYRLKSHDDPYIPREIRAIFDRLCSQIGVPASVTLRMSAAISIPCTYGTLKPVILLPVELITRLSADEIEAILAHEFAHIRRYDYVVNIVQHTILSILYYHPVIHLISREIDREREICCDDMATKMTTHPKALATALGKLALLSHHPMKASSGLQSVFGRNSQDVAGRMTRLMAPAFDKSRNVTKMISTGVSAMAVVIFANFTLVYANPSTPALTKTDMEDLRDAICYQIKMDGYYTRPDFSKSPMVRVNLNAEAITLNGVAVPDTKLSQYQKILNTYGLKRGTGQYIYFDSQGDDIELGTDKS